jgi:hypothetical protein
MDSLRQAELLALVEAEQRHMRALLARLQPAHLTTPGLTGSWSVKDVLAHVTFWHRRLLRVVEAERRGRRAEPLMRPGENWAAALARINEQVTGLSRAQPIALVLADFRQTSKDVFALITGLRDDELTAPLRTTGEPLLNLILDLAYEHPHAHRLEVQDWLLRAEAKS